MTTLLASRDVRAFEQMVVATRQTPAADYPSDTAFYYTGDEKQAEVARQTGELNEDELATIMEG